MTTTFGSSGSDNLKTGERRNVSVLFSDMKGFTSLSERMDPEEVDALMTRVFSLFESIINRYDGFVEKYIGDALVAVFGTPRIHEDDPARAINAALDFLDEIQQENRELEDKRISLSFRTGIHTGLITTGKRGRYDVVTGHTLSIASRLESNAPANGIYVSQATKEKCENDFLFSDPVSLTVKGKDESLSAFLVKGRNTDPYRNRELFVGREAVLDEILRAYLKHDASKIEAYMLSGEAGIGKTRLAGRFIERINQFPGFNAPVLYARAQRYRPLHYAVVTDLLADYFGLNAFDEPDTVVSRLSSRYGIDREVASGFGRLMRNASESRVVDRAYLILQSLLESIFSNGKAGPYPPLVYIDNIHHLDKPSRDFLQHYLRQARLKPFFLLAGRELPSSLREVFPDSPVNQLTPLTREESVEYIQKLWPEVNDEETIQNILTGSFGNPLFIREYVKFARENRDTSSIPMTIQNVFLMSMDKYPEPQQDLLKKLSVFILSFSASDAQYIEERTEGDPAAAAGTLAAFFEAGILGREGSHYFFKHDVFKKALYNSLLNYNKRILHKLVAELLMDTGNPHLPRLLQHLIKAEDYEAAREVLMHEPNRFFSIEYVRYLDILLDHTGKDDYAAIIECLYTKSAILFNNGKTEAVDSILKQILKIAVSQMKPEFLASAYHLLAAYNLNSYSFQKALFCGTKALYHYRKMPDMKKGLQDIYRILSLSELLRNSSEGSAEYIRLMDDELSGEPNPVKHDALLERHLLLGEYGSALEYVPSGDPDEQDRMQDSWFYSRFTVTKLYWQMHDYDRLKTLIERMLKIGTKHYSILSQIQAQYAVCCKFSGDGSCVDDSFAQAEFYLSQIRNDFDQIDALRTLCLAYVLAGNDRRAEETAREGITIGLRHSSYYSLFTILILVAEIYLKRGLRDEAKFFMSEAAFSVRLAPLLSRKDLILYHYFSYLLDGTDDKLETAFQLLEREKAEIREPELVRSFMASRSFSEIEKLRIERNTAARST